MAEKNNYTLWQRLTKVFGPDSTLDQQAPQPPVYNFDKRELLRTTSKQEYEKEKLQAQQTAYLAGQWKTLENNLYSQAVYYEPTRLASFYDYESMDFCLAGDTKIATPDGFITIKELAEKGRDYEFITYAYDHNQKKVVPAEARNAHYTRDEMTYKITFDDDSYIIATYEHQLLKRDGSFERVKNLKAGDSMMPFYRKSFYNNENYNWIYTCNSDEGYHGWITEHNIIAEHFHGKIKENEEVHHINFNGKDNNPDNLVIMDRGEHRSYHAKIVNKKLWADPEHRKKMSKVARKTGKLSWNGRRKGKNNPAYFTLPFDNIIEAARKERTIKKTAERLGVCHVKVQREIMYAGYKDWATFCDAYGIEKSKYSTTRVKDESYSLNHKIAKIEEYGVIPVYDLTVPGYKNFATDTIFSHNTPEISAALDIYAEESTTTNEDGFILEIYSESKRIKSVLGDLFNNRLDINTNLPMWTRNCCKYGDNFVFLKLDPEKGVIGCQQLPNIEITRQERGMRFKPDRNSTETDDESLKFIWQNKDMTFNTWQIAHFRLLGDDRKLPYGTCLKYNTRIETKCGYKEIKDILIGDEVWSFNTNKQKKELSKVLDVINSGKKETYKISTQYNFIEASKEHKILCYDQTEKDFKYKYPLDFKIGDLLVINESNNNNQKVKIDKSKPENNKNGYWNNIDLIPDYVDEDFARFFGFMIGDGWIHNQAIHFALSKHKSINERYVKYLEKISGKEIKYRNDEIGGNAWVNSKMVTIILKKMEFVGNVYTKRIPSWVYSTNKNIRKAFLDGIIDADGSLFIDEWNCLRYNIELANEELINDIKILVQSLGLKSGKISNRSRTNGKTYERKFKSQQDTFYFYFYESQIAQKKKYEIENRKTNEFIIEPIKSIESSDVYETYDIYVENEYHNFYANGIVVHNSIIEKGRRIWKQLILAEDAMLIYRTSRAPERRVFKVFVGNMDDKDVEPYVNRVANKFKRDQIVDSQTGNVDLRYNQMAVDQDYFIPVRDPNAPNPIDTLPGAQNLSEIADIEYIQKKLLTSLRVPKAFLGFEEVVGDGKNLALQDIRFARSINRVQKAMIQELNKIAIIHLYLLGFEDELNNFTLGLTNPSTQADLLKVEEWQTKIQLYRDAVSDPGNGIQPTSSSWAKKHILGFSDEEIKLDLQQQRIEKAVAAELERTSEVIINTGIFSNIDKLYGKKPGEEAPQATGEEGGDEFGGLGGGGSIGGGMPEMGGEELGGGMPEMGGEELGGETLGGEEEITPESIGEKDMNILIEGDLTTDDENIDLSKGKKSIDEIGKALGHLLK